MTKKTSKKSNNRLSEQYKFKRMLAADSFTADAYKDRDARMNRIAPVKDVILQHVPELVPGSEEGDYSNISERGTTKITKYSVHWPFRVEFIEQILDIEDLWVVTSNSIPKGGGMWASEPATVDGLLTSIHIDIVHIHRPEVAIDRTPFNKGKVLSKEEDLLRLEDPESTRSPIFIQSNTSKEDTIKIIDCNILPYLLHLYNASFYHRDVANLYAESLTDHFRRYNPP